MLITLESLNKEIERIKERNKKAFALYFDFAFF
jgi:hypothetical protein